MQGAIVRCEWLQRWGHAAAMQPTSLLLCALVGLAGLHCPQALHLHVAARAQFAEDPGHAADLWALAEELTGVKTDASLI